ncbi:MAG: DUF424 family protein [Candidatus Diapherotrites archaeon]|nr:DUF424 family protein [Candidatus Diapherotrites archaeon]
MGAVLFHKIHSMQGKQVLAVCDKQVVGKQLRQGEIEFNVSEHFFKEKEISEKELRELLHEFDNINLVGNKAVAIAIDEKIASKESVIEIQGVKHVQIFKI